VGCTQADSLAATLGAVSMSTAIKGAHFITIG
jgi:hypothetical protein